MSEHPVLARLCEAVGMQYANWVVSTDPFECPQPPAYLRKPNRIRKRGIIRAALGKRACGWQYRVELDNWPRAHIGDIRRDQLWFARFWDLHRGGMDICAAARQANEEEAETRWAREDAAAAMQEPTVPWAQVKRELGLGEAAPATGGQSAASCGAKEGRSTCSCSGDDGQ